jgi:DNA polymerase III subunit delta
MPSYHYNDLPKIFSEIKKGEKAPVYLIFGDSYLAQEVTLQLIDLILPDRFKAFNLETVDGEKEDIYSILERIQTFPLFPGPKIVSVKNPVLIFSAGKEDRLWKKAEEAWKAGTLTRCAQLLQALFRTAGISSNWKEEGGVTATGLIEKLFPDKRISSPDWFEQAFLYLKEQTTEAETTPFHPDQVLESALDRRFPENHHLILQLEGNPGSQKLVKAIAERGVVLNFSFKQGKKGEQTATLKGFLSSRLSQEGKSIHPKAEALLFERIAPEIYQLEMELEKLFSFLGDKKQIQVEHVTELVTANREQPLYELTGVLGERRLEEGLKKLKQLWEQGYNPLQVLAAIANTLRRLMAAKKIMKKAIDGPDGVLPDFGQFSARILPRLKQIPLPESLSKVHPFVLFNTLKIAEKFSLQQLIASLETLQQADWLIKTSGATPGFLLEDFIISFCRKSEK